MTVLHSTMTGENLHAPGYFQNSDPGAVGAGKIWIDTSSGPPFQLRVRNAANNAWADVGAVGEPGPAGPTGPAGTNGTNGSRWYNGTTAPSNALGANGDYYVNDDTNDYYTKVSGAWQLIGNLGGPPGPQGPAGATWHYLGDWSSSTAYVTDDVVSYNGELFIATSGSTNSSPTYVQSGALQERGGWKRLQAGLGGIPLNLGNPAAQWDGAVYAYDSSTGRMEMRAISQLGAITTADVGVAGGVASLDGTGKVPVGQLPALAISDTFVVSSQAAMLALTAEVGDVAVRTDTSETYILQTAGPGTLGHWQLILTPTSTNAGSVSGLSEAIDDRVAALLVAGANITVTYDDTANTLTIAASGVDTEGVQDIVGAMFSGGNVTATYNDAAGTIALDAPALSTEQVQDIVGALLVAGSGVSVTYDDAANTVTIASTVTLDNEAVQDMLSTFLVAGTGIGLTYNDAGNTLTIAVTSVPAHTQASSTITDFVEAVQDVVGNASFLVGANGLTVTYDDTANTLTLSAPTAAAPTAHAATHAVGGSDVVTPASIGAMVNPMTTQYDIIVGQAAALVNEATTARGASFSAVGAFAGPAANAFDSNDATYWGGPNSNIQQWLAVDLGAAKAITSFRISQNPGTGTTTTSYSVQSSTDNVNWTSRYTYSGNAPNESGTVSVNGGPITARYWRAITTSTFAMWAINSFELHSGTGVGYPGRVAKGANGTYLGVDNSGVLGYQAFPSVTAQGGLINPMTAYGQIIVGAAAGVTNEATPARGASATASASGTLRDPASTIDSDNTTSWYPGRAQSGDWLRVNLGSAKSITSFRIVGQSTNYSAVLESSTDDTNWTTRATYNSNVPADTGNTTISGGPISAQYWRWRTTSAVDMIVQTFELQTGVTAGSPVAVSKGADNTYLGVQNGVVGYYSDASTSRLFEDFYNNAGALGFAQGGSGSSDSIIGELGSPGIVRLTSATSNNIATTYYLSRNTLPPIDKGESFDVTWRVRLNTTSAALVQVGLGNAYNDFMANGAYLEKQSADTNWFFVLATGNTKVRTDSGVAVGTGWVKVRIRRLSATTVGFTLNAGTEVVVTQTQAAATYALQALVGTNDGTAKTLDLDYVSSVILGLTR